MTNAATVYETPAATPADHLVRPVRLASGIVMLVYLTTHLVNHALGNISFATAEAGLSLAKFAWQSWPGTIALYGAAVVQVALALLTLFEREHWHSPSIEWLRRLAASFARRRRTLLAPTAATKATASKTAWPAAADTGRAETAAGLPESGTCTAAAARWRGRM